jgi:CBS domain-containing protein
MTTTALIRTLGSTLGSTRVEEAMHPGVITCAPEAPLTSVAALMAHHRIHCVVVWGDSDLDSTGIWGVVSDLDLIGAGDAVHTLTARAIAATAPLTVTPDESVARAAQVMVEHEVSHVIVADPHHDVPLGILSTLDVARLLAAQP